MAHPSRAATVHESLRNGHLRRVLLAYLLFQVAEWSAWIAVLVWAYGEGGSGAASLIAVLELVPAALLAGPVAYLCGRLPLGVALCGGYAAQAAAYGLTGAALLNDAPFVVVALATALVGVTVTATRPVHNAVLPAVSRTAGDLTAGNAATGAVEACAAFLGPLLSGLLIGPWGPGGVLVVAATGTGVAAVSVVGLGLRTPVHPDGPPRPLAQARIVLRDPAARLFGGLGLVEYVVVGALDILLVVLALDLLGMSDGGPGVLNSALGIGGLVGAAATVLLVGRRRMMPAVLIGGVLMGLPIAFAGISGVPLTAFLLVAASGAGKLLYDVAARTLLQRVLPDRLLVAVFGLQETGMMAGLAVGACLAPFALTVAGNTGAFVVVGCLMPAAVLLAIRRLRRTDATAAVPTDRVALLEQVPFLALLPPRVVERLALESLPAAASAGEVVIREGDPGDRLYVVVSGRARVTIAGRQVRELGPGDWFGELALLSKAPRSATVTARTDVALLTVERVPFLAAVVPQSLAVAAEHATTYVDLTERPSLPAG